MPPADTDQDWEHFARADPYWAVLTEEKFRKDNLTDAGLVEFFAGGETYVERLFRTFRARLDESFGPRSALDFGCGVGRVLLPLSRRCASVVGVDVADTMLHEAEAQCRRQGASNVRLVKGDDQLSGVTGPFDLVHSFIVLQHVPAARGLVLLRRLLDLLAEDGFGALHLTYDGRDRQPANRWKGEGIGWFGRLLRRAWGLTLPLRQRTTLPREMLMSEYPLDEVFRLLADAGAHGVWAELTNHDGNRGLHLMFRKVTARPRDAWC
jgi:SAM-dependent methyltransferase